MKKVKEILLLEEQARKLQGKIRTIKNFSFDNDGHRRLQNELWRLGYEIIARLNKLSKEEMQQYRKLSEDYKGIKLERGINEKQRKLL